MRPDCICTNTINRSTDVAQRDPLTRSSVPQAIIATGTQHQSIFHWNFYHRITGKVYCHQKSEQFVSYVRSVQHFEKRYDTQ